MSLEKRKNQTRPSCLGFIFHFQELFEQKDQSARHNRRGASPLEKNTAIKITNPLITSWGCDWMPIRFMILRIVAMISPPMTDRIGSPLPPKSEAPPTTTAAMESNS